jgi:starch-binding outer membrane protein, SusD/RagB family
MKKNNNYILLTFVFLLTVLSGCTDLNVPVDSELTSDVFPKTNEDFISVAGPVYTKLASNYNLSYWFLQEASTDEMILTANGGNWFDDSRYKNDHLHTWNAGERHISETWTMGFQGISQCNVVLDLFKKAEDGAAKNTAIAEIKAMRAFFYFMMTDLYGAVPIVKQFGDSVKKRNPRTEVFSFIESELLEAIPNLSPEVSSITYGRPTKWMAYALLAKLYINAPVYINEDKNNLVVQMCDSIINEANKKGTFSLTDDYIKEFNYDNGPQIKDFIFAVPYDGNNSSNNYPARYWLHAALKTKYSLPFTPSGCMRTLPEFYAKFNDVNDVRDKIWLTGKQYNTDGTPITIATTKKGLDNRYTGTDGNTPVTYQLEFTPTIEFRDLDKFDTGDDQLGKAVGYRCNKFFADKTAPTRIQNNDVPVFRYADVLLMKAEAILRGATATLGQTPVSLVNQVRTRAKATTFTSIDLDGLLDERARELCSESWRRNDLIRFGKFESKWGVKTDNDIRKRIFPVPSSELDLNPSLGQNDGY